MSDLGADIRNYYERIVERIDPSHSAVMTRKRASLAVGVAVAAVAAVVTLLVFGLVVLLGPSESGPVDSVPPTSTTEPTPTTEGALAVLPPTVILLGDGTEIATIDQAGLVLPPRPYQSLASYVVRELTENSEYWPSGVSGADALGLASAGETGLTVRLSVDPAVQDIVEAVISRWRSDLNTFISVVVVDNHDGRVLAAGPAFGASGDVFDPDRRLPAASLAQVYTTVAALEAGISLDSVWDGSSPQSFTSDDWEGEWTVRNTGASHDSIGLDEALYSAVDTVFAGVGVEVGGDAVIGSAVRLGADIRGFESAQPPPSVAVGNSTTIDTFGAAAMFATLSRDGVRTNPVLIESIADASGQVIYQAPTSTEVTVDSAVVQAVTGPLSMVPLIGTAPRANLESLLGYRVDQIGKTATGENYLNAWYVGSTDQYTIAVGVGRLDTSNQLIPLENVDFNGQTYSTVFGGSVPAPIWAEIMSQILESQ